MQQELTRSPAPGWGLAPRVLESSPIHRADEAVAYDAMVRRHAWILNRPFVALVLKRLRGQPARILDVGAGPGWIPIEIAAGNPHAEVWALDSSDDMLARAGAHARAMGVAERLHFMPGDAGRLPFEAGAFDLVISNFTLHHLDRPEVMLNEMARVLAPGGGVLLKDLRRQPRWKCELLLAFSRHVLRYDALQLQMYRESLEAALTLSEARSAVARSALAGARVAGFRGLDFLISR